MALSVYQNALRAHPLFTKSATSAVLALAGQRIAAAISGGRVAAKDVAAYATYGLLVGGPFPHYFYSALARAIPAGSSLALLKQLAADRLLFAPVMTFMFFFVTQLVKTRDVAATLAFVKKVYPGALVKNYQFWTPAMIVNLRLVPLEYRPVFGSFVAMVWTVYLALLTWRNSKRKGEDGDSTGSEQ